MNKCVECGKEIKEKRKFCGHSCSAKYNNSKRVVSEKQKLKTSNTLRLGFGLETLEQKAIRVQRNRETWQKPETRIKQSISKKLYYQKFLSSIPIAQWPVGSIRKLLFSQIGNNCQKCSYSYTDEKTGKGPFEIHHKDGNNKNWDINNLEILCLICHWKTGNYRFKNRKHSAKTIEKIRLISQKSKKTKE